jgi:hypothetical protein
VFNVPGSMLEDRFDCRGNLAHQKESMREFDPYHL